MIPIGATLQAFLSQPYQTVATCWQCTLKSGTVLGFTDHDQDIVFDLGDGAGSVTYMATTGYTRSDIAGASDLSVDNLEIAGMLQSPSITEADLYAGVWDFAQIKIFALNWQDTTMGALILRVGWLGEVTVGRNAFKAEMRGLTQAYSRTIGELTGPSCRNKLGDSQCAVNLAPFTATFTVTGVNADNQTFTCGLTQPGPTGSVAISAITRANPGVVTTASALDLPNGAPITIYGCTGMIQVNTTTTFNNPNSGAHTFQIPVDTSGFPAYTGGGHVVGLGSNTGYFDFGIVTWTGGNNNGLSMEVKSYTVGQVVLQLPMPYAMQVGDTGSIVAGCDKSLQTCHDRFSNVVKFRGEPYMIGTDRFMQVGKQ